MDVLTLSRLQFAITTVYHFFFAPLTLGLSLLVALMQTLYFVTKRPVYKDMTKFWGKLFLINFAMGVVTGIVQEFQFGMNWSEYSRFVGDIFGAPLAVEALLAFFLESTFLGVWIFGWDKISAKAHLAAIWLVALATNVSALWILIANSFMQEPVGYVLRNGRAEMNDFFALLLNPNVLVQFPHVFAAGLTTASFFVLGIAAWHLLRGSNVEMFKRSFTIAAVFAVLGVGLGILNGHAQAQHVYQTQPMKIASAEGLFETEQPASFSLLTIGDSSGTQEIFALRIPYALSLLACNNLDCAVQGINNLQKQATQQYGPGDYTPPAWILYWSFRAMVGVGLVLLVGAVLALFFGLGGMLEGNRWLRVFPFLIVLPYVATTSGWIMAEVGRVPWIVFGLLKIEQGVSLNLDVFSVGLTLVVFTLIYAALMVTDIYLLVRFARGAGTPQTQADQEKQAFVLSPAE
ncbi:MAG: cytochrome ubiquinol oxidase subunit I [Chloroflexi bacterium]|nr:cytochrome ubiquinol oxidase subunit I [Chloroflexota bacterium]